MDAPDLDSLAAAHDAPPETILEELHWLGVVEQLLDDAAATEDHVEAEQQLDTAQWYVSLVEHLDAAAVQLQWRLDERRLVLATG